ncbi:MAG: elongator complex protein 3 [Hyphomicrobiales bacterium]
MINKHFTIPIFVPELACPFQCIYCNQRKISGQLRIPEEQEIKDTIEKYLQTIPKGNSFIEIGFFGGNFTGIAPKIQENFLKIVQPYVHSGKIKGIRLSTRPDYINEKNLDFLKKYGVNTIELGAQSLDNEVLQKSFRGHSFEQVQEASNLIIKKGFSLGLQMMLGLPGDTKEKALFTANKIVELGADNTRIYPCLVIKGTELEHIYNKGEYQPLSMEQAVDWAKEVLLIFEKNNVNILRVGLHPSEGLMNGEDLIAGPYHVSFKEFVLSSIWHDIIMKTIDKNVYGDNISINVPVKEINYAIGYKSVNRNWLLQRFNNVRFYPDNNLKGRNCIISNE